MRRLVLLAALLAGCGSTPDRPGGQARYHSRALRRTPEYSAPSSSRSKVLGLELPKVS